MLIMPSTYAHWHFGNQCIKTLPNNVKQMINKHRDLYDIAVHGPDVFFYDFLNAQAREYGSVAHVTAAKEFFNNAIKVYHNNPEKEEMMVYIIGYLTHFALDYQAHGYVERKKEESNISHNRVETEYDAYLMRKDGRKVNLVDRSESLHPNKQIAYIASLFVDFNQKQTYLSLIQQRMVINALNCIMPFRYRFARKLLNKSGRSNYQDLPIPHTETQICKDSNLRMEKLQAKALKLFPLLYKNLMDSINSGTKLNHHFDNDFNKGKNYDKIPVLSYSKELKYKV